MIQGSQSDDRQNQLAQEVQETQQYPARGSHCDNDRQLNQLAQKAQQHPARSYERRRALTQLTEGILRSDRVSRRPYQGLFPYPQSVYDDLYSEALNTTFLEMCRNIDRYDPTKDVMAWCNFLLKKRFLDVLKDYQQGGACNPTHTLPEPEPKPIPDIERLRCLLDENPGGMFTEDYIQGNQRANFQLIAYKKIWQDFRWSDISTELNIAPSSLCEFYKKKLKYFTPYFIEYLKE
jgi:hypothetical protein